MLDNDISASLKKGVGMSVYKAVQQAGITSLLLLFLTSCYQPPYNNFQPYNGMPPSAQGTPIKAYLGTQVSLLKRLRAKDIQFIQYGDTSTLIVPTDRYFVFNSPQLNELCYPGLVYIVQLLKQYPDSTIYVAGFTDNVGSRFSKNELTQDRAEAMITYLWANGIKAKRLNPEGYGDKYAVADNHLIHGSAQNRRLEIQWFNDPNTPRVCCLEDK
jgi:outer membrane protein OmpA-like peptidoglycan-associated protein